MLKEDLTVRGSKFSGKETKVSIVIKKLFSGLASKDIHANMSALFGAEAPHLSKLQLHIVEVRV